MIRVVADINVYVVTINPIEVLFTKTAMKRARSTLLGWINGWKLSHHLVLPRPSPCPLPLAGERGPS